MVDFRVDLSVFRGPLDLLLYLVRKHELEILDIPIAPITDQYLEYLAVLQHLDVDAVGDFLAMAATLVEIKSQECLPRGDEVEEDIEDPRQELVQRLLDYKQYRDAASILEEQSRIWQQQFPRLSTDLAPRERDMAEEPVEEIELWDLVSAMARVLRTRDMARPSNIVYDETPIHVYMTQILERLAREGRIALESLFEPGMIKSKLIGIFLAVLELVRHHHVHVEQIDLFGEIWLAKRQDPATDGAPSAPVDVSQADNYEHARN
jgi:segregation and condensation protein A